MEIKDIHMCAYHTYAITNVPTQQKNNGGLPWCLSGKGSACNTGDAGSIPGSGKSPGEGNGNPLKYSWSGKNTWEIPRTEEPGGLQSMES